MQRNTSPTDRQEARKTQEERTDLMRLRLIQATLDCIAQEGYAGTTVSRIVEQAGASRGAFVHHFATKAELIEATVVYLGRTLYVELGQAVAAMTEAEDRLEALLQSSFDTLMGSKVFAVFQEMLVASRTDAELLALMRRFGTSFLDTLLNATRHYFEPRAQGESPEDLMLLTQWLLRGMGGDEHLMVQPETLKRYFAVWLRVLRTHLKPRPGVKTPPPKPRFWDAGLG